MERKPLLSIGIIFKNEIRCLERCVKSFQALREAVSCELVMADTGSDDGSRKIAEQYADILFDFPWVGDFSAARNAVIDRCSGAWLLTVDADEWLDEDFGQLTAFLRKDSRTRAPGDVCTLIVRNYTSAALEEGRYTDFVGMRMARASAGLRYTGSIHEHWDTARGRANAVYNPLSRVILHHDGYVCLNNGSSEGQEKLRRNRELLEKELEEDPQNMRLLMQEIEAYGSEYEGTLRYAERALEGLEEKWNGWDAYGPSILRHLIRAAIQMKRPEASEWIELADRLFPDSVFTRVDTQYLAAEYAWRIMDCPEVIRRGESYLQAIRDYREGRTDPLELMRTSLALATPYHENTMRDYIARSCLYEGQPEKALETLGVLHYKSMDGAQVCHLLTGMLRIHSMSRLDTAPWIEQFWEHISADEPSRKLAEDRKGGFLRVAARQFAPECCRNERERMTGGTGSLDLSLERAEEWAVYSKLPVYRHGYTLFKSLLGRHDLGASAVVLDSEDAALMEKTLGGLERVDNIPIHVLAHALTHGVRFPLPGKPMSIDTMDALAGRLASSGDTIFELAAADLPPAEDLQAFCWARGLVMAAVRRCNWENEEQGQVLICRFVEMEREFLPLCYAPGTLREDSLFMLPEIHRFGWYCVRAFDALEAGDSAGYARFLRTGLVSAEGAKPIVEFLLEHTPELHIPEPKPSGELLALAEKVRMMLSAYPVDDPAVMAIKQSPVYQKVARLIEGPDLVMAGGLKQ